MKTLTVQAHPLRLFWGENYAPKSKIVQQALARGYNKAKKLTHLYPGGIQGEVKQALAKKYGVDPTSIILGSGIEGLLTIVFQAYVTPKDQVVTFWPTFSVYKPMIEVQGGTVVPAPVGVGLKLTADDVLSKVTKNTKLICLAWPNTTTGCYHLELEEIQKLLGSYKGLIVIDECYFGIGKKTTLALLKAHDNLLVLRSASKSWGLAGIRLGFGFAFPGVIAKLHTYSTALAPDPLPIASYLVLLEVLPYSEILEDEYKNFQGDFITELKKIKELVVYPSEATFIPVSTRHKQSLKLVTEKMKVHGFALKDTGDLGYLLIAVPPKTAWSHFLYCFKKSLKEEVNHVNT